MLKPISSFFILLLVMLAGAGVNAQTDKFSYGLILGMNYPTTGAKFDNYSGEANPTLGMFVLYRPESGFGIGHPSKNKTYTIVSDEVARRLTFVFQPTFSVNTFREQDVDRKYNNYYIDATGLVYIQPFIYTNEFHFFTGIRPSYLTSYNTELFSNGSYENSRYAGNFNRVGRVDFMVPLGISMAFSEAVSLEFSYLHSFTDNNTAQVIKGRPSSFELSLKLNAVGLANQFGKKEESLREQVTRLSKGSLLVMLPTPNPSEINKLKEDRKVAEVEYIYHELHERNKKVIREFRSFFDFCPVYFFMDTSAYKVISKNFNNVFVNSELDPDPNIKTDSSNFFVASFCSDISVYTTKHQYGLFVYDNQINQLPKPFNVPSNLIGANLEGDPMNFFKKRRYTYSTISFERIVSRFNARMHRYKEIQ